MSHIEEFRSLITQMTITEKSDIKYMIQSKIADYHRPIRLKPFISYSILLSLALIILIPIEEIKFIPLAFMAGYVITFDIFILRFIREGIQNRYVNK